MSKHTPGPWYLKRDFDYTYVHAEATLVDPMEKEEVLVAKVGLFQTEANARLIAAAPELLEAAKLFIQEYDAEHHDETAGTLALKKAIAKAEWSG